MSDNRMKRQQPNYNNNNSLLERAAQNRGLIISHVIDLEKIIDWRISKYYCQNEKKRKQLEEQIVSRMPFSNKIRTLVHLLNQYDQGFFKEHPRTWNDLEKIRKTRNQMAHSWIERPVNFRFSGNNNNHHSSLYSLRKINNLKKLINRYCAALSYWAK
jgi:Na+/phosphate symporter